MGHVNVNRQRVDFQGDQISAKELQELLGTKEDDRILDRQGEVVEDDRPVRTGENLHRITHTVRG
jgi:hypothetical protein